MNTVDKIIDFAEMVAKEDAENMERYFKWQEYIEPLVQKRFSMKNKFDITLRSMVSKEIGAFINMAEKDFLELYELNLKIK